MYTRVFVHYVHTQSSWWPLSLIPSLPIESTRERSGLPEDVLKVSHLVSKVVDAAARPVAQPRTLNRSFHTNAHVQTPATPLMYLMKSLVVSSRCYLGLLKGSWGVLAHDGVQGFGHLRPKVERYTQLGTQETSGCFQKLGLVLVGVFVIRALLFGVQN